ncbi:MAG: PAS domain-containing sensor histidine kinase [Marinoscillum sp.]
MKYTNTADIGIEPSYKPAYYIWYKERNEVVWSSELYHLLRLDPVEVRPDMDEFIVKVHPEDQALVKLNHQQLYDGQAVRPYVFRLAFGNYNKECISVSSNLEMPDGSWMVLEQIFEKNSFMHWVNDTDVPWQRGNGLEVIKEQEANERRLIQAQKISNTGWYEYNLKDPIKSKFSDLWLVMHDFQHDNVPNVEEYLGHIYPFTLEEMGNTPAYLKRLPSEWGEVEFKLLTKNGDVKYICNSSRIEYQGEEPAKIFGVTTDVTDIRKAKKALLKSEKRYRLLSETSRDVIFLLDGEPGNTTIAYVSDSVTPMLGYRKEDLIGRISRNFIHPDDRPQFLANYISEIVKGKVAKMTVRLLKKSGTYLWAEVLANLFEERKIRLSIRDITDRKVDEERLIKANNDLNALIKATENLIFIISQDRKFEGVIANDVSKLHIPPKDFIDRPIDQIWTDKSGLKLQKQVEDTFETEQPGVLEYPFVLNGVMDWYRAQIHSFMGYDGKPKVSVVIETITIQKKAEQEIRKSLEMERELSKMRSNFVAMASHQFRTPLTVIKSNMQLLDLAKLDNPVVSKVSSRLTKEVNRLISLMEDILILGKVQSESLKVSAKEIDLHKLLKDIADDLILSNDKRKLKLSTKGEAEFFYGDYGLMRHAILNIVTNAFKYSENRPGPEVLIDYTNVDLIKVHIKDYGIGIHPDDHHRIFKDFFRADNVGNIPGTGLGMSIALEFLRLNKCSLKLDSDLEKGATFTIILPKK